MLIQDEGAIDRLARYLHLNPVRIGGLGLGKEDQRRARVLGCEDPGEELVSRRVRVLREYAWSSWRIYAEFERPSAWLSMKRVQGGCGGVGRRAQVAALVEFTEAPIRQGHLENPWEGLVGGTVLGEREEAMALIRAADKRPGGESKAVRESGLRSRPDWRTIVRAAERILGRQWEEMVRSHGDWGRDGVMAVATRELGWRLVEVVREVGGIQYSAASKGAQRFWRDVEEGRGRERCEFAAQLRKSVLGD